MSSHLRFIKQLYRNRNHPTEFEVPTTVAMNSKTFWEAKQPVTTCYLLVTSLAFLQSWQWTEYVPLKRR
jgi:hypothetical protein